MGTLKINSPGFSEIANINQEMTDLDSQVMLCSGKIGV